MANERRLIDADGLKAYITECSQEGQYRVYAGYAVGFIDGAPSVDAVPVVRCKDCKHYAMWADGRTMNHCDRHDRTAYDDDFCSYGERKSGTQPQREGV